MVNTTEELRRVCKDLWTTVEETVRVLINWLELWKEVLVKKEKTRINTRNRYRSKDVKLVYLHLSLGSKRIHKESTEPLILIEDMWNEKIMYYICSIILDGSRPTLVFYNGTIVSSLKTRPCTIRILFTTESNKTILR